MHEAILSLLKSVDSFAAAEEIQKAGSSVEVAKNYEQLVRDLYWKAKDLSAVVAVVRFGLSYCLTLARAGDNAAALLDSAKKMAFNLASFCWPGWDESGITVTESDLQAGADAARLNLRLAIQLKRPPLGMSMAHWMLGGYALAMKQFDEAARRFSQAIELAREANDAGQGHSNEGFHAIALMGKGDADGAERLAQIIAKLEAMKTEDSREYARQLQVARRVFIGS